MYAFGRVGLILPTPKPPFFRLKLRSVPPLNLPCCSCWATANTPVSTCLVPLVRTRLPSLYWSVSTPIVQAPAASAALKTPSPQPPATAKITFAPWEISFVATVLHLSVATKSCEYWIRTFVPGTAFCAQKRYPAIQISTGGIARPPTAPTVLPPI